MRLLSILLLLSSFTTAQQIREGSVAIGDDLSLHYAEAGQGAQTLVLIPGWTMTTSVWRDQIDRFASSAHVVSVDPRSQGKSTITTKDNTPEQRARDLHEFFVKQNLENIVLVGWSQGVQDVAAYAAVSRRTNSSLCPGGRYDRCRTAGGDRECARDEAATGADGVV